MRFLLEETMVRGGRPPSIHPSPWMSLFIFSSPPWPAAAKWGWMSGGERSGGPRTWSWAYQVSPNIEPISKVVHIWIIVCRVEWINERMSSFWIVCQRVASVYCLLSVGRSNVTMLERHYVCGVSPRNPRTLCSFPIIITAFSFSTAIIYNLIVPVHKISRRIK